MFFVYWSTMELVGLPWFQTISPVVCCFPPLFPTFFESIYKPLDDHWPALLRLLWRCQSQSRQSHDTDSNWAHNEIRISSSLCYAADYAADYSILWLDCISQRFPEYLDGFSNFSTNSPGFQMPSFSESPRGGWSPPDQEMHHLNDPQTSGWENGCRKPRHSW